MADRPKPIYEIAGDLSQYRERLSVLPRYHPLRHVCARHLALELHKCYELLNQKDDLDDSILYLTELLLSPPHFRTAHGPGIVDDLFTLASWLLERSKISMEPEDAISATKYLRHLQDPADPPFDFPFQLVTSSLVATLTFPMVFGASDVVQTLDEAAILTNELLTLDPSNALTTTTVEVFASSVHATHLPHTFPDQPLNRIIGCLRLAKMRKPEIREAHLALANCLYIRYYNTMGDELDEAVSILDEAIASGSPEDELVARCQKRVAELAMVRSVVDSNPETSEEAIYRARAFLASSSTEDALYPTWSDALEHAAKKRFENFGPIDGVEASSSDPMSPPPTDNAEKTWNWNTPLDGLLNRICNKEITDMDEAIELGRNILLSSNLNHLEVPYVFGDILFEAFKRTDKIEYLNESINTLRPLLALPLARMPRRLVILLLAGALFIRAQISPRHHTQDLHDLIDLQPHVLNDGSDLLSLLDRIDIACSWASLARATQHQSVSTAYETAISSIQSALLLSPTLQLQHAILAIVPDVICGIPLDYASYQVEQGQLEQAVEARERGRALLWTEMRHLRTSIDQLFDSDPELGEIFAAVNRELEELTKSIPPSHRLGVDDVVADDLRAGDEFGYLLLRQRGLLKERDKLISQIRALPSFDRFMTSPSFDTLHSAASSGPVIIVNHSKPRSDILILLHNAAPSLIPTPYDFYDRASTLKDRLLTSRGKDGLDSSKYDETLASVLAELYKLVGKPVIDRLRLLQVPDYSRIWWCPISVFCSLPLHAMGPIPSDDGEKKYFLDLYICSYTPSLSALIQSRGRDRDSDLRSSDRPSVLLVAQTDPSLPTVGGEVQAVRALDTEVTSLISEAVTPAAVLDGFKHHRFVHIACHGTLEAEKPFEAGFELHGGERLTLLEIVRADLPTAEFAFLSACHTAEVTEGSIIDEGLHLAAAVQFSGFRSVVGTMWAMVDEDGRDLAENFYKSLFSNSRREQGIPFHERSAKALRFAVKKLRRKRRITLERWINFVHYGA